jgi:hypothetical protein
VAYEEVTDTQAGTARSGDHCELEVGGVAIDLAYVYVAGKSGLWLNLAMELDLPVGDVPRALPASVPPVAGLGSFEGFYAGAIGSLPIMVELGRDGRRLDGSYLYEKIGIPLSLQADGVAGTRLRAHEEDDDSRTTGLWSLVGSGDGSQMSGTWSDPAGKRRLEINLQRFAERVTVEQDNPHARIFLSYPSFVDGRASLQQINRQLDDEAEATRVELFESADDAFAAVSEGMQWETSCSIGMSLYRPGLVSMVEHCYSYTGGAHGISGFDTKTYLTGGQTPRLIALTDLFSGAKALARLETMVQAELIRQGAEYVIEGDIEIKADPDLADFALAPRQISFYFGPYHVGPYVAGEYTVSIPYDRIIDLIGSDSPLQGLIAKR